MFSVYRGKITYKIPGTMGWEILVARMILAGVPAVAQRVKYPALSLQQLRSLLRHGFHTRPRNFHMPRVQLKKKKERERMILTGKLINSCKLTFFLAINSTLTISTIHLSSLSWFHCSVVKMAFFQKYPF